jgi:hypothetical protein
MPASDILNPAPAWQEDIQDSMCPNYGFTRKRAATSLHVKAVGGTPWSRETANTGHVFPLTWISRSWKCAQRLKKYYEQYGNGRGYFTLIDWDGGARHYVGSFTGDFPIVEAGNGMWDVQNLTFEETPQAEMIKYPGDWDGDAVRFFAYNDYGDQDLYTFSSSAGQWTTNLRQIGPQSVLTMDNPGEAANVGDWASYEYRGYGFRLYLMGGVEYGQCTVELDGTQVGGTIDCYVPEEIGPKLVLSQQNVPLDLHRVKLIVSGTKNASAYFSSISFHSLEVMR